MSTTTRKLLHKIIRIASQPIHILPSFIYILQIISSLQILSVVLEPLYFFTNSDNSSESLYTANKLAYYIHFVRILGQIGSGNGLTAAAVLIAVYLLALLISLIYCAFIQKEDTRIAPILPKILTISFTVHSRVLFYWIHYFLMQSLDTQMNCSAGDENCGSHWIAIIIILAFFNFLLALFKELLLNKPLKTTKDIASANNTLYPFMILLHKAVIICLIYLLESPKITVITLNVILSLINLYLALETFPFYNLTILRINVIFDTLAFSFSLLIIPEVKGSLKDSSIFIILAVSSLFIKIALIRLNFTLKKVMSMRSKNPQAAIILPSLLKEWVKKLNILPTQREFNTETLFLSGFLQDDIQEFAKSDGGKSIKQLEIKYYTIILGYFNQLSASNAKNELLLLAIARIYAKKLQDTPRAIKTLNYMKTLSPNITIENAVSQLSVIIHKANANRSEQSKIAYENYFEQKNRTIILKKEIQKEISEHIALWKLIAEKDINTRKVYRKAGEISQMSVQIQRYWQIYFAGNETTNFELSVNYGYYLDLVEGMGVDGIKLIKNAFKTLQHQAHTKVGDDDAALGDDKSAAILVVSIEQERQGKILNTCHSASSLFELKKGSLIGMDINTIIPKAFCAKHTEKLSQLYLSSKLNVSNHPISYVRTVDGHYFKAEVAVHLNSSMDHGLSFVVHVKRQSENESLIIVDHHNKIADFSSDIGQALNLNAKENIVTIDTLCPELTRFNHVSPILGDLTRLKERNEKALETLQVTKIVSQENDPLKNTEAFDFMSQRDMVMSGRDMIMSGRDDCAGLLASPKSEAIPFEDECKTGQPFFHSTTQPFFEDEAMKGLRYPSEPKILKFNIYSNSNMAKGSKRFIEYKVTIEGAQMFGGYSYKVLRMENIPKMAQMENSVNQQTMLPLDMPSADAVLNNTFADNFPEDPEKSEVIKMELSANNRDTPKNNLNTVFVQFKPMVSMNSNASGTKDLEIDPEKLKFKKLMSVRKVEVKSMKKAESVASSQYSTKVLAKSLITLFRENKINRLTRITINIIYLVVILVILVATIDTISTKASLTSMENAVTLVDLINKRLYKGVFAWQTSLFIMTYAFGVSTMSSGGGGGGGSPPSGGGGGGSPPSGGSGGGGGSMLGGLQSNVEDAVLDAIENNNLLQTEVMQTKERSVIENLYAKSIVMWDPEYGTASYYDSFRANEILAHDSMFIANFDGTVTDLSTEPEALSASNNTANSYLIEVEDSIEQITAYFTSTKDSNVKTLTTIFSMKNAAILVLFLFTCKLFQSILLSYKRLFHFVSRVPQSTLQCRINQLENLRPYFDADNSSIFDNTEKRVLEKHLNKDKTTIEAKAHLRTRDFSLKELTLYMLRYLFLALIFTIPAIIVFLVSYNAFCGYFSDLEAINQKMVISYRIGTQISMILPSFYFYQSFKSYPTYKIRNEDPLDQFYLSVEQLHEANQKLLSQVLTSANDDAYVYEMLTSNVCDYVTSNYEGSCTGITNGDETIGLLDFNSKYYIVANAGITEVLAGSTVSSRLDPYSLSLKDIYQTLAEHFLDLFQIAVASNQTSNSNYFKLNVGIVLLSALFMRVFVLTKFKEIDVGVRKVLRFIPYQIIEDQKAFMQYLKREFKEELERTQGKSSK